VTGVTRSRVVTNTNPRRRERRTTSVTKARISTKLAAAGIGVTAAGAGVAASSGVAALTNSPSPIISVGNRFIILTPAWLKDFAIQQFGTNDKAVLIGSTVVVLALIAAVAGVIGLRHPRVALAITAAVGLVAIAAAAIDRTTDVNIGLKLVPAVVALVVSVGALAWMLTAFNGRDERKKRVLLAAHPGDDAPSGFDRRKFLAAVMGTGLVIVAGGIVTKLFGGSAAASSRAEVMIPKPAELAPPIPAGAQAEVTGVSSYITSNTNFYRIDTALQVPDVPADTWNLRIHGLVDDELNFSFQDLLDEQLIERRITLTCVSNEVGGPYIGNATWIGVSTKALLERTGVQSGADAVKSTSADNMTIGTPLGALTDDRGSLIAIAMNGEPLPLEHGFPARMVVPGLYGYVSATKWLTDIEVTRFSDFDAYWTPRGYAEEAPIKFSSRIDVPKSFQSFDRDAVRVGGVAWAQTVGIKAIEVMVDDGPWQQVKLAAEDNIDTWRQWSWQWKDATPGSHSLTVRATDASGKTQTSDRVKPLPDGSTGWHNVQFTVT